VENAGPIVKLSALFRHGLAEAQLRLPELIRQMRDGGCRGRTAAVAVALGVVLAPA